MRRTLIAERVRDAMISIALVSSREIARLNREHLSHAGPTDVISFALGPGPGAGRDTERVSPVGDIYICPDVVRKNAGHYGVGMREELARVIVHGTLHALGYDHEPGEDRVSSDMWRKQERILADVL